MSRFYRRYRATFTVRSTDGEGFEDVEDGSVFEFDFVGPSERYVPGLAGSVRETALDLFARAVPIKEPERLDIALVITPA